MTYNYPDIRYLMEKFIRYHKSTYFSVIPNDLILELEKFFDVKMSITDDNTICYAIIECPNLTIPLTWDVIDNDNLISSYVEKCEEFDKIVSELPAEFSGILLPGFRCTMAVHYGRYQQLTLIHEDRFLKREFKLKLDTPTSLIIMKKIKQLANDLKIDKIKQVY